MTMYLKTVLSTLSRILQRDATVLLWCLVVLDVFVVGVVKYHLKLFNNWFMFKDFSMIEIGSDTE